MKTSMSHMGEPKNIQNRMEFYEEVMHPDFPDEIALQIDRPFVETDPDVTFSEDAVDALAEQFRTFLMARIVGTMQKTGKPPLSVRATVRLNWNPGDPVIDAGPYFHIAKDAGLTPIDHTRRRWETF